MPRSWLLPVDGKAEIVDWPHEKVCEKMGGMITFVGGIDALQVFALALQTPDSTMQTNPWCTDREVFLELPVHGPVLFIATDEAGEPMDVDADAVQSHLLITI